MTCPQEPLPTGWRVWRGPVPAELTQLAINVRDHINDFPYGSIAATTTYQGNPVAVFKSHHVWTYRNGVLVTGICIPGASLLVQPVLLNTAYYPDNLSTPDPSLAVFPAEPSPPDHINWGVVAFTAGAAAAVVWLFWEAIRHAGRAISR